MLLISTLTNISWRKQEIWVIKYRQLKCFINIYLYPGCPIFFCFDLGYFVRDVSKNKCAANQDQYYQGPGFGKGGTRFPTSVKCMLMFLFLIFLHSFIKSAIFFLYPSSFRLFFTY